MCTESSIQGERRDNLFVCLVRLVLFLLIVGVAGISCTSLYKETPVQVERIKSEELFSGPSSRSGSTDLDSETAPDSVAGEIANGSKVSSTPNAAIMAFIGTEDNTRFCQYDRVMQALDKESVPILREMLDDEAYKNRWRQIGKMIAWLSDRNDEESVSAILEYVQRRDIFTDTAVMNSGHIAGKAVALGFLGLFQTDLARESLRRAVTYEGAKELIASWVDSRIDMLLNNPEDFIVLIRGHAASGLVLSREPENISLVRKIAEEHIHLFQSLEYLESEVKQDVDYDQEFYGFLADAMTQNDLIKEIGIEEYLRISDTPSRIGALWEHAQPYMGTDLGDGRYIIDPCPMCGKTRD